jgi:hypothetical protein
MEFSEIYDTYFEQIRASILRTIRDEWMADALTGTNMSEKISSLEGCPAEMMK